jgi:hypothetical protein
MIPQIVMICLVFLGLGMAMAKHGQPRTGNENFFVTLISAVISHAVLYWGGFYDVFFK